MGHVTDIMVVSDQAYLTRPVMCSTCMEIPTRSQTGVCAICSVLVRVEERILSGNVGALPVYPTEKRNRMRRAHVLR